MADEQEPLVNVFEDSQPHIHHQNQLQGSVKSGHTSGIPKVPGSHARIRKYPPRTESAQSSSEQFPMDMKSELSVAVNRQHDEYSDSAWAENRSSRPTELSAHRSVVSNGKRQSERRDVEEYKQRHVSAEPQMVEPALNIPPISRSAMKSPTQPSMRSKGQRKPTFEEQPSRRASRKTSQRTDQRPFDVSMPHKSTFNSGEGEYTEDAEYTSQDDYLQHMSEVNVMFTDDEIKDAFECFDLSSNGYITQNEIRVIMESMGEYVSEEEIDEMIRMLDNQGNGEIIYQQFYKMATGQSLAPVGSALPPSPQMIEVEETGIRTIPIAPAARARSKKSSSQEKSPPIQSAKSASKPASVSPSKVGISGRSKPVTTQHTGVPMLERNQMIDEATGITITSHNEPRSAQVSPEKPPESPERPIFNLPIEEAPPIFEIENDVENHSLTIARHTQKVKFTAQTVENLFEQFINVTGSEFGELSYDNFLQMINCKIPDRYPKLENDRATRRLFNLFDLNMDGTLNFEEFLQGINLITRGESNDRFKLGFAVWDTNNESKLTKNVVIGILRRQGMQETQAVMKTEELMNQCGDGMSVTLDGVLSNKEQALKLMTPIYDRAEKISRLLNESLI